MLSYNCSFPRCNLKIVVTKVFWRRVNGVDRPYCCSSCYLQHLDEGRNHETQMADKNEALQTSSEVSSNGFLEPDPTLASPAPTRKLRPTQTTFEDLNFFW